MVVLISDFIDFCGMCGFALTKYELAADIRGDFVLFDERGIGSIQITLCADCKEKVKEIAQGGLDKAIGRRIGVEGQQFIKTGNRVQKRESKVKVDPPDDDEEGGVPTVHP